MSRMLDFQGIVLKLVEFWKDQGCVIVPSHNIQIREGTLNPATALGILGPEPLNIVSVERAVRPKDGRFGHHPNRLQLHHQLQVVLKPEPGNPQELYLKSLESIGIMPNQHDIRFVEDNWESEALGVWGRGWEVWLDGLEITQFTYFQQAAEYQLDPVPVEITYGLERIVLAIHKADTLWQIDYGHGIRYEELFLDSEVEQCKYYFDVADVDNLKALYSASEKELNHCLDAKLVRPAYDFNLQCIHLFNVLDTRGVIGVAERANYHHQLHKNYAKIAALHLAHREAMGFPLGDTRPPKLNPLVSPVQTASPKGKQSFILEIGTEELPVSALTSALRQLRMKVPELLTSLGFEYGRVEIEGTPRRIAINVHFLTGRQKDTEGDDGLTVPTLAAHLPQLIADIHFNRSMRWNKTNVYFSRPIRWLVALYGKDLIPFSYAGVNSGRTSKGLRSEWSPEIRISDAYTYAGIMRKNGITHVAEKRAEKIQMVSAKLAAEKRGAIPEDVQLMEQVSNMIERPTPLRGQFDEQFLSLPNEVLVAVMKKRQRYFPVYDEKNQLMPYFLAVRNGDERHLNFVIDGNEKVLNARFADAQFLYKKDSRFQLADFLPKLESVTFHPDLGSMFAKAKRLEKLMPLIGEMLALSDGEIEQATRAALLSKADLATEMVGEMSTLQGVMGGYYAINSGEDTAVALAISEQYNPISKTKPGLALSLADQLDSLVGLFGVGEAPSVATDPYRLRRMAYNFLTNIIENKVAFDLPSLLNDTARLQPVSCNANLLDRLMTFFQETFENLLIEKGCSNEIITTTITEIGFQNPFFVFSTIHDSGEC